MRPENQLIRTEMNISLASKEAGMGTQIRVEGAGALWVDGLKIYEIPRLAIALVGDEGTTDGGETRDRSKTDELQQER